MKVLIGINDQSDEFNVEFEKYGAKIFIDDLSTGEKQIVYRGAYLLKNVECIKGGIAIVDEPELGMHSKWQEKSLHYYRNLFTPSGGEQSVQMFFATHSEYVIRAALHDTNNVLVILLKNVGGKIKAEKITAPFVLSTITAAEINYFAFDMPSTDYHNQLYGYIQDKYKKNTVSACDKWIENNVNYDNSKHEKTYQFKNDKGKVITYKTLPTYIRNAIHHPESNNVYTTEEIRSSIELMIKICK